MKKGSQDNENKAVDKKPKRSTKALRDRVVSGPLPLDRIRSLAHAGLTPLEIAAQIDCALERLEEETIAAEIERWNLLGSAALRNNLWHLALAGNFRALKFLLTADREVRLMGDIDDLADILAAFVAEAQAVRNTDSAHCQELTAIIQDTEQRLRRLKFELEQMRLQSGPRRRWRQRRRISIILRETARRCAFNPYAELSLAELEQKADEFKAEFEREYASSKGSGVADASGAAGNPLGLGLDRLRRECEEMKQKLRELQQAERGEI